MHIYGVIHIKIVEHKTHLNAPSLSLATAALPPSLSASLPPCRKLFKHKSKRCNFHCSPNTFSIDYYELILWNLKFQLIFWLHWNVFLLSYKGRGRERENDRQLVTCQLSNCQLILFYFNPSHIGQQHNTAYFVKVAFGNLQSLLQLGRAAIRNSQTRTLLSSPSNLQCNCNCNSETPMRNRNFNSHSPLAATFQCG